MQHYPHNTISVTAGCTVSHRADTQALPPWLENPSRLISWWEMQKFQLEAALLVRDTLKVRSAGIAMAEQSGDPAYSLQRQAQILARDNVLAIHSTLSSLPPALASLGLHQSSATATSIANELSGFLQAGMPYQKQTAVCRIEEIERAITLEMQATLFLVMSRTDADLYQAPRKGWEEVNQRFPATMTDVEECSFCLACERYTAAVFHSMRIAEVGAIAIGNLVQIKDPKPGWSSVIRELRLIIHRKKFDELSDVEKKYRTFLSNWLPLLESVNTSWRDRISHVENRLFLDKDVDPRIAREIVAATQTFMRRLAEEFPN